MKHEKKLNAFRIFFKDFCPFLNRKISNFKMRKNPKKRLNNLSNLSWYIFIYTVLTWTLRWFFFKLAQNLKLAVVKLLILSIMNEKFCNFFANSRVYSHNKTRFFVIEVTWFLSKSFVHAMNVHWSNSKIYGVHTVV